MGLKTQKKNNKKNKTNNTKKKKQTKKKERKTSHRDTKKTRKKQITPKLIEGQIGRDQAFRFRSRRERGHRQGEKSGA